MLQDWSPPWCVGELCAAIPRQSCRRVNYEVVDHKTMVLEICGPEVFRDAAIEWQASSVFDVSANGTIADLEIRGLPDCAASSFEYCASSRIVTEPHWCGLLNGEVVLDFEASRLWFSFQRSLKRKIYSIRLGSKVGLCIDGGLRKMMIRFPSYSPLMLDQKGRIVQVPAYSSNNGVARYRMFAVTDDNRY